MGRGREVLEGQGSKPPRLRLRPGARARRQARGSLGTGDQEEAEASEIAGPGDRRGTGHREDGQPPPQRRSAVPQTSGKVTAPPLVITAPGFAAPTSAP